MMAKTVARVTYPKHPSSVTNQRGFFARSSRSLNSARMPATPIHNPVTMIETPIAPVTHCPIGLLRSQAVQSRTALSVLPALSPPIIETATAAKAR